MLQAPGTVPGTWLSVQGTRSYMKKELGNIYTKCVTQDYDFATKSRILGIKITTDNGLPTPLSVACGKP